MNTDSLSTLSAIGRNTDRRNASSTNVSTASVRVAQITTDRHLLITVTYTWTNLFNSLSLPNNNLVGTIPDIIGRMKGIRTLDLSNNKGITGTIPSSLASMTSLDVLDLSGSSLTGT